MFDLIVKNGLLIDPSQKIHMYKDVAFFNGRVAAVEENMEAIPGKNAKYVIDASNRIITPGFIDIHVHLCLKYKLGLNVEALLNTGTTTAFDAGTTGALTFSEFQSLVKYSPLRLYAFLNISSLGLSYQPELENMKYANVDEAIRVCEENRNLIKGIKVRLTKNALKKSNPLDVLRLARQAADSVRLPLIVHGIRTNQKGFLKGIGLPDVLAELKRGDVFTHTFALHSGIFKNGEVIPELRDAIRRGVIIDVGHGAGSFSFLEARKAIEQNIQPEIISTDLYKESYVGPVFDLPTTLSKFMHLGLSLYDVITKVTVNPAKAFGLTDYLGTLKVGAVSDAVIFELEEGNFPFIDSYGETEIGCKKLIPKVLIHGREIYLAGTWSQAKWVYTTPTWFKKNPHFQ